MTRARRSTISSPRCSTIRVRLAKGSPRVRRPLESVFLLWIVRFCMPPVSPIIPLWANGNRGFPPRGRKNWAPKGLREEPARAIVTPGMNQRRALITGITGQDGSYLAELLLEQGYEVFGLVRRSSSANLARIQHILPRLHLVQGDLLDQSSLMRALAESRPQELYNLAAQSSVPTSFDEPVHTAALTAIGVTPRLESRR